MALEDDYVIALEAGDVHALRTLWARSAPHLPQPDDSSEAEILLHLTRTMTSSVSLNARRWSHHWLSERGLPSCLPLALRPKSERIEPVIVEAVGVAVGSRLSGDTKGAKELEAVMSAAVLECYADGITDPVRVKARIMEVYARARAQ